ncbi:hypothetical protein BDZ85DRAFT_6734 [Elsinoe ampelina]|uniref:Uncharacterized protein n=1 Tax=Elsinoe ampelina TaxID=302913 RepID=A0A6A6GQ29_9PEZI|nr:hypothetical protein BDZ85DRAFT_6734 [Elsinoe ampelina]
MHFPKTSTFAIFLPLLLSHLVAAAPLEAREDSTWDKVMGTTEGYKDKEVIDHEGHWDGPVAELGGVFDRRDPLFGEGGVAAYAGINPDSSSSQGGYDPNMKKRDPLFEEAGGVGAYAGIKPLTPQGKPHDPNMKKRDPLFEEAGGVAGYAGLKPLAPQGKPHDPNMKKRDPLFEEAGGVAGYAGLKPLAPQGKPYDPNLKKRQQVQKDVPGQFDGFGVEMGGAALGVDKAWGNFKEAVTPDMNPNLVDHEGQWDGLSAEFAGLFDGQ